MNNKKYAKANEVNYLKKYQKTIEAKSALGSAYSKDKLNPVAKRDQGSSLKGDASQSRVKSGTLLVRKQEEKGNLKIVSKEKQSSTVLDRNTIEKKINILAGDNSLVFYTAKDRIEKNKVRQEELQKKKEQNKKDIKSKKPPQIHQQQSEKPLEKQAEEDSDESTLYQQNYFKKKGASYKHQYSKKNALQEPTRTDLKGYMKESIQRLSINRTINTPKDPSRSLNTAKGVSKLQPIKLIVEKQACSVITQDSKVENTEEMLEVKESEEKEVTEGKNQCYEFMLSCLKQAGFDDPDSLSVEDGKQHTEGNKETILSEETMSQVQKSRVDEERQFISDNTINKEGNFVLAEPDEEMFPEIEPLEELTMTKLEVQSFQFGEISHPKVQPEYQMQIKQDQCFNDSLNYSEKEVDTKEYSLEIDILEKSDHIRQNEDDGDDGDDEDDEDDGDDEDDEGKNGRVFVDCEAQDDNTHQKRSFIVDDQGNKIERVEVTLTDFGFCQLMVIDESQQEQEQT